MQTITQLDLCWNQIGDAGVKELASVLLYNQVIDSFFVYNNYLISSYADYHTSPSF